MPVFIALICQLVVNQTSSNVVSYQPRTFRLEDYEKPILFVNSGKIMTAICFIPPKILKPADSHPDSVGLSETFFFLTEPKSFVVLDSTNDNLTEVILDREEEETSEAVYRSQYILAADFQSRRHCLVLSSDDGAGSTDFCPSDYVELVAMYNSVPTHARPLAQNVLSNTLLSYLEYQQMPLGEKHNITTTNHPLDTYQSWEMELLTDSLFISGYPFAYGVALAIGIGILVATFVVFPLSERITSAKQVSLILYS